MKIISQSFNHETGVSSIELQDKNYRGTGFAKISPEDKEYYSKYTGFRLAELRANIKIQKQKISKLKIQLNTVKTLKNDLIHFNREIPKNIERRINLAIRNYAQEIESLKLEIESIKEIIDKNIKDRDRIIQRYVKDKVK